jgi:hypothetical protein
MSVEYPLRNTSREGGRRRLVRSVLVSALTFLREQGAAGRVEHAMIRSPFLLPLAIAGCHTRTEATEGGFG